MRLEFLLLSALFIVAACTPEPPKSVHLPSKNYNYVDTEIAALGHSQKVYVPIYADIYHSSDARRFSLTATLSVRNTSMRDSMYVAQVDYYDSEGNMQRAYLERTILLKPLESVEFVVEYREDVGGAGANFIVAWGTNSLGLKPVIQAVMIGTASQQGISFVTESVVIEENTLQQQIEITE